MQVIRGATLAPPRIVIYGEDKIGKSTFGASADTPLFVQTEDGAEEIGPDRLPRCDTYAEFRAALAFAARDTEHATVVVDNLSGLEALVQQHVCRAGGVQSIEDYGYGKGYAKAEEVWAREVLPALDACRAAGKVVIVIGHSQIRRAESPESEPYDQHTLDLHKSISALVRKWADVIGFAARSVKIEETDVGFGVKRRRGVNVGDKRVLHLVGAPAFVAGNRYGLPAAIKLSWPAFVDAMAKRAVKSSIAAIKHQDQESRAEQTTTAESANSAESEQ